MNYPGGKGGVYQKLINQIPPHRVYIETHLGGGAVMRNKRPAEINIGIDKDKNVIELWNQYNPLHFDVICDDAIHFLNTYYFKGDEFVYCDPPYIRSTRKKNKKLYFHDYSIKEHTELLELLKTLSCKVMISGYKSDLYMEILQGWHTYKYQAVCHHGIATEWVWMNYKKPTKLHDYRYLGENYRERERLKRISYNLISRLKGMPVLEREALLFTIQSHFFNGTEET